MMIRTLLKEAARIAGIRVTWHRPANRFDAMRDVLELLRCRGYDPRAIIDAGANAGTWSRVAHRVFPAAHFTLIEPQPACQPMLQAAAASIGAATIRAVAVSAPERLRVGLVGGTAEGCTGVRVIEPDDGIEAELDCEAVTLDSLLTGTVVREDRALLKLDLETHEIPALEGARHVLNAIEVIVSEAQIYPINDNNRPVLRDLIAWLHAAGFELHDFAAMNGRHRDGRLRMVDAVFVRADSPLNTDRAWE